MKKIFKKIVLLLLSKRTIYYLKFDIIKCKTRFKNYIKKPEGIPPKNKLHFGCGSRFVKDFLNVDLIESEVDIDLSKGMLPWNDDVFEVIVSQHVIEHLELYEELLPLLRELNRTAKKNAEIWLSCPDLSKICKSYLNNNCSDLVEDRKSRWPNYSIGEAPPQHFINLMFHQNGAHKNLFDFELLNWVLKEANFKNVQKKCEDDFLSRFPEFPPRNDNKQSLYVKATN